MDPRRSLRTYATASPETHLLIRDVYKQLDDGVGSFVSRTHPDDPRLPRVATSVPSATLAGQMDAAVWTAIGLLAATSLGTLFYFGARIDGLGSRVDGLGSRIDALGARIDARLDSLESRIDVHLERHAGR